MSAYRPCTKEEPCRALVVEDSETLRRLVEESARWDGGFSVETCETLAEAMVFLAAGFEQLNVILLDLNLPDSLRAGTLSAIIDVVKDQIPVVVWTGNADQSFIHDLEYRGAQDVIVKGVSTTELLERCRSAIAKHRWRARYARQIQAGTEAARDVTDRGLDRIAEVAAELENFKT